MARRACGGMSHRILGRAILLPALFVYLLAPGVRLAKAGTARPTKRDVVVEPSPLASAGTLYRNSWAVVAGVNEFQNPKVSRLNYAANDANSAAQALQALGLPSGNITSLLNRQATRSEIERVLSSVLHRRAGPQDRVVVFCSTHGVILSVPGGGEERYLLRCDTNPDDLPLPAFSIPQIKLLGQRLPTRDYPRGDSPGHETGPGSGRCKVFAAISFVRSWARAIGQATSSV